MFRIVCLVEDKHLASLLRGMAGVISGQPEIVPVANAIVQNGKVRAKIEGDITEIFAKYLDAHPGVVNADYARAFQKSIGRSATGYSNVLQKAQEARLIRKNANKNVKAVAYERVKK